MRPIATAICVPARDEAAELPNLFAALDRLDRNWADQLHVCLLLDGCGDASAALAAAYRACAPHHVWIEQAAPTAANAGRARHRAMALGLRVLDGADGLLLSTDADSAPCPNWLQAMLAGLRRADLVAGKIVRGGRSDLLQDRLEAYYDRLVALRRRLDPVPWEASAIHHHVGGANIGIHAEAYRALGGFLPLPRGEDARLIDDAARAGLRVRRDAACVVHTSARHAGRADGGLATSLRTLAGAEARTVRVAHPADAAWQYQRQADARAAYALDRLDLAAAATGLAYDHVRGVARDCPNAEAFAMRIVPEPPGGMRSVPLPVAEHALDLLTGREAAA